MTTNGARPKTGGILTTLQRGLTLLHLVASERATARELAGRIGLKRGTCYNLLRTLTAEGFVVRLPNGQYDLGSRLASLHDRARARLAPPPELLELLHKLHQRLDETVYMVRWSGEDLVLQRYLESARSLRVGGLEIGYSQHTHARASCKAILAHLPEARIREYFATRRLARLTRHTKTSMDELLADLRATVARGYALDLEEFSDGICCVAVPFFDAEDFPVGSYSVSAPATRFHPRLPALVRALRRAAAEASRVAARLPVVAPARLRKTA
ncbi:MAG TPA: IclR family transcriptional regulator [Candidatus Binatia bacterium]|nr:IclR family transcriptional regulator [Candidatus Binatia bacterium]